MPQPKSFLSIENLSTDEIRFYLDSAQSIKKAESTQPQIPLLSGKTIVNLFYENSTRTRASFEVATRRLGGAAMSIATSVSSVQKGETLLDTAKNLEAMNPHAIVVRHSSAGSPYILSQHISIPVINAGDGFHEHPTQALLDAFTMEEKLGSLKNKKILILGDIAHSRVARSNIYCLQKLGAKVTVCGPGTLLPPSPESLGVKWGYRPEDFLSVSDVVMALRVQFERQNKMQLPSVSEYSYFWGLTRERARLLKPGALILHPGPINRGVEIDPEVADGKNSVIMDQVTNGVVVRMAVLAQTVNPQGFQEWLEKEAKK